MGASMEVGSSEAEQSAPVSPSLTSFLPTARPTHCSPKTQIITANVPRSDPGSLLWSSSSQISESLWFYPALHPSQFGEVRSRTFPQLCRSESASGPPCFNLKTPFLFQFMCWLVNIDGVGLLPALHSASRELQASCSCRLASLAISKTAVMCSVCHWSQNSAISKNWNKTLSTPLVFLSKLKGKEVSTYLHFKFKICI